MRRVAHEQWATNTFSGAVAWAGDTRTVRRSRPVRSSRGRDQGVLVSCDLGRHAAWLTELCDLGFDGLYLHQIGPDQDGSSRPSVRRCSTRWGDELAQMSDLWWKNAVIYCLDIETFYDNGDGWGDLTDLIGRSNTSPTSGSPVSG